MSSEPQRGPHAVSSRRQPHETSLLREPEPSSTFNSSIIELWMRALDEYCESIGADLRHPNVPSVLELASCETGDDIVDVIVGAMRRIWKKREGSKMSQRLRRVLKPLVHGLSVILDASAETSSSLAIPGGKGIFAALSILLKAADDVSTTFDDMEKLLNQFGVYIERLQVRVRAPLGREARVIAVKALVEMLKAFTLATKMLRMNRFKLFVKSIVAKGGQVQDANDALQQLMSDEERMAVAELLVGIDRLSVTVNHVNDSMTHLSERAIETTGILFTRMGENESQQKRDFAIIKDYLQDIATTLNRDHDSLRRSHQPGAQLRRAVRRLSSVDQDIIWRALATFISYAMDSMTAGSDCDLGSREVATSMSLARAVETALPMASTFLLLFIIWKLCSVTRPLGSSGGSVILIDVLGEVFVLQQDTFASWKRTHEYIVHIFRGRPGASYVDGHNYGLGDSERPLISPEYWSDIVKPGMKLKMSVVVETLGPLCPYCQTETTGNEPSMPDGSVICSRTACGRPYICHRDPDSITFENVDRKSSEIASRDYQRRINESSKSSSMGLFQRVVVEYWSEPVIRGDSTPGAQEPVQNEESVEEIFDSKVDYVMRLNDWLCRTNRLSGFHWSSASSGPKNYPFHLAIAVLNGEEIGRGRGDAKSTARRRAAFEALVYLGQI